MTPFEASLERIADRALERRRAVALIPPVVTRTQRGVRQVQWSQWDRRPEAHQWLSCKQIAVLMKCSAAAVYRHFRDNRQRYRSRKVAVGSLRVLEIRRKAK